VTRLTVDDIAADRIISPTFDRLRPARRPVALCRTLAAVFVWKYWIRNLIDEPRRKAAERASGSRRETSGAERNGERLVFRKLRYNLALRRLQNKKRRTRDGYTDQQRDSKTKPKSVCEYQELLEREMHDVHVIEDEISRLQTSYLIDEAQRYFLPTPAFSTDADGAWEQAATAPHYQLKQTAIEELRLAIGKEKKATRARWQSWIALEIGLVGALVGLVAAFKK
jgi:hypothetical protein